MKNKVKISIGLPRQTLIQERLTIIRAWENLRENHSREEKVLW